MPEPLPSFDDGKTYFLTGKTLNQIVLAIESRTPLAGAGLLADATQAGVRLRLVPELLPPPVPPGSGGSDSGSGSSAGSGSGGASGDGSASGGHGSGGSASGSVPGSGGSGGSGDGGSGSGGGPSGSKNAIVPIVMPDLTVRWIAWQCLERPEGIFEDVMEIPLTRGRGEAEVAGEHLGAVEPASLRVTSRLAVDSPALLETRLLRRAADGRTWLHVKARRTGKIAWPKAALIRVEGVRLGHGRRWVEHTGEEALANCNFYRRATGLPPLPSVAALAALFGIRAE